MNHQRSLIPFLVLFLCNAVSAATIVTIDAGPVAGHPSIAIGVDGFPVIAYETADGRLRLAKCADVDCTTQSRAYISDPPTGTTAGRYNSVAIGADGNPAIAFYDTVDVALKLVKCSSSNCAGGGAEFRTIDPGPYVPIDVALAFDADGKAAFAYQDASQQALMLARCANAGCGNVNIEVLAPLAGGVHHGQHAAIAIGLNGAPVVSGRQWSTQHTALDFIICAEQPCTGPLQRLFGGVGQPIDNPAMALRADFRPAFAYHGVNTDSLIFGWCEDADCSGSRNSRVLDDGSLGAGAYTAIAVREDGRPVIAYQKRVTVAGGANALYVVECNDSNCAVSRNVEVDLHGSDTGVDPAIAIGADGGTVIAYFDASASSLMLAKCSARGCDGPGDRIFADGFD